MRNEIRERARPYFEGASPAHDWHHVQRVARLAETLVDEQDAAIDEDVLFAAVWLHDVGRAKEDRGEIADHAEWGAREAGRILRDLDAGEDTVATVQHCIRAHRYSNDMDPETPEAELLSDADNLDALGAVGVARVFSYGGELGQPLYDPERPPEADDSASGETQLDHVHEKILSLRDRMYTEAGRELADQRHDYVVAFAERFEREAAGER